MTIAPDQPRIAGEVPARPVGERSSPHKGRVIPTDAAGRKRFLVIFDEQPLSTYRGGVAGLAPTHAGTRGETRLAVGSPASQDYLAWLSARQQEHLQGMQRSVGRSLRVDHRYLYGNNGVAVWLSQDEARRVARRRGVRHIELDYADPIATDAGPGRIGAPDIWNGLVDGLPETRGEGVVVGIIDTGINFGHPSFEATDGGGYTHVNPNGSGQFLGWCDPANPNFNAAYGCTDKLIGAWDFADATWGGAESDGPDDSNGHGSHVASTAAGNRLESITLPSGDVAVTLSGVAPHANLIAYDVCFELCASGDVVAALDQAIADGVDVVNESIGIGGDHFAGAKQQAYLSVIEAGIIAVRAAGNDGPMPGTVASEPPWTITVAATTHGRSFSSGVLDFTGGDSALADMDGLSLGAAYGPAPIVSAVGVINSDGVPDDGHCLVAFPAGTWTNGEIVVCERSAIARTQKGLNVKAGGAGGMVLADDGNGLVTDVHFLPAVHISQADATALKAWLASGSAHQARIPGSVSEIDEPAADQVAGFSSRGPDGIDMIKPDLAAPGQSIFAATRADGANREQFEFISGTSMASPHVAGAAALMRALHADWSATEVRSALMGTAASASIGTGGLGPVNGFDIGGGRVDLRRAARSGLLLDEELADFQAADTSNVASLNVPSLMTSDCTTTCSWQRTVTNPTDQSMSWSASYVGAGNMVVSPAEFTLAPGASQILDITLDLTLGEQFDWNHGRVVLAETQGSAPPFTMPVAAFFAPGSAALEFRKSADRSKVGIGGDVGFSIDVTASEDGDYTVIDALPEELTVDTGSLSPGAVFTPESRIVSWSGSLAGPIASIAPGASPAGYLALSGFFPALDAPTNPDEGGYLISGLDFIYGGKQIDSVILSVNGTIEPGSASGFTASFLNQGLPDPTAPNNIVAPFWTDLDMSVSGQWYIGDLTDGVNSWHVFEWTGVPLYEGSEDFDSVHTFQIWIQEGTSNIWFTYGPMTHDPDFTFATVGFENDAGTVGTSYYFDGTGTQVVTADSLVLGLSPAESTSVQFTATANAAEGTIVVNEAVLATPSGAQHAWTAIEVTDKIFSSSFDGVALD